MLRPEELRIGNWVFDTEGKPNQVNMDALRYLNSYGNTPICQVHPIPITEEILLKCGFIWDDFENDPPDWLCWKVGAKSTLQTDRSVNFSFIEFTTILGRIKVQYLHQLQNLYFALTGQELTYTP